MHKETQQPIHVPLYILTDPPQGGDFAHKPSGALAIARLSEVKQNRVQKAIYAGKRPGAFIDDGEHVSSVAGRRGHGTHHQVHGLCEVKRQEADAEHCRHHDDHLHRLVPLLPGRPGNPLVGHRAAEDLGHAKVAHHHTNEGQHEAEAGQSHAVRIVGQRVLRRAQVITHRAVPLDARGGEVKRRSAQDGDHQPDSSTDTPRQPATALLLPHRHWMADAHIALQTDAGAAEDAGSADVAQAGEEVARCVRLCRPFAGGEPIRREGLGDQSFCREGVDRMWHLHILQERHEEWVSCFS
ncbi:hypothetical protein F7725_020843 [Dissostichus mawsoni]|uniref:Uncharacterized protein n=1 Tax=Dissostichus mawsoni TaxID=36200 RepID=A0A7J5YEE8_DISMA|nr:hypothetical protein F7725_020843 [Dissostichus mawsoni]